MSAVQGVNTEEEKGTHSKMRMPSRERLIELYDYSPESGDFYRRHDAQGFKAGSIAGKPQKHRAPYKVLRIDRVLYLCHRLAWLYVHGVPPVGLIDHINGDGLDNRIDNLRVVSNKQNIQASQKPFSTNTSGFRGVSYSNRDKCWRAGIHVDGRRRHLGHFDTPEAASAAYQAEKQKVHFV
jgi:hypothetical protein